MMATMSTALPDLAAGLKNDQPSVIKARERSGARAEGCIEFIDQRNSRWDVERRNLVVRYFAQELHETSQAVAVRNHQHALVSAEGWGDCLVPIR
jgi:hypothetical protein